MVTLFWAVFWIVVFIYFWTKDIPVNGPVIKQRPRRYKSKQRYTQTDKHSETIAEDARAGLAKMDSINMFMDADTKLTYMASNQWKQLKQQRLVMANNVCERCGFPGVLELHHITYENLGNEDISDVAMLCRQCHQIIHNKYGYDRVQQYPIN